MSPRSVDAAVAKARRRMVEFDERCYRREERADPWRSRISRMHREYRRKKR